MKTTNVPRKVVQNELRIWKKGQGVEYRLIGTLENYSVKISIEVDSYDNQSRAVGYIFDLTSLDWKPVYSLPYPDMKSIKTVNIYDAATHKEASFNADRTVIVEMMCKILRLKPIAAIQ